jgi:uncharacterized protein (TIGR02453 family)
MADFNGFQKEAATFLKQLKKNNTQQWFLDHRRDYEDYIKTPSIEFVIAMGEKLKGLAPDIHAIPKVNQSLFRINRDTRFSPDKSPYKTNVGIWFWEGNRKRMECSGFYFHLGDGNMMLGTGMYIFPKDLLKPFRDAVVDKKHGPKLSRAAGNVTKKGYTLSGKHYKRVPKGYDGNEKNAAFLLHNGLAAMWDTKIPNELYSEDLIEYAFKHYKNMSPLHEWLKESLY